jgi:hypothetical protein
MYFTKLQMAPKSGGILLEAAGLGPAYIEEGHLFFDGSEVAKPPTYKEFLGGELTMTNFPYSNRPVLNWIVPMQDRQIIDASSQWVAMSIRDEEFVDLYAPFQKRILCELPDRVWIEANYCSIYGDCFEVSSKSKNQNSNCFAAGGL